jgi:hypothetical protein
MMKVITIATDLENAFLKRLLIPSCQNLGLDLTILHMGKKEFKLRDKQTALAHYFAQCSAPEELIIYTDGYDTLFLRDEQYIREAYAGFPQSIVFSAESNCWPLGPLGLALQEDSPSRPYPYLNSGGFMGPAGDLLKISIKYPQPPSDQFALLRHLRVHGYDTDQRFEWCDQYYWTLVQLLETETIGLDNNATLFETLGPAVADVSDPSIRINVRDFRLRGKEAASYQEERARLELRLTSPSSAAQVHFANPITKAVALDLFDEGRFPRWLRCFDSSKPSDFSTVEIYQVPDAPDWFTT